MVSSWAGRAVRVSTVAAVCLLAGAALVLGGCAGESSAVAKLTRVSATPTGNATKVVTVNPYDAAGSATGLTITLNATGECQPSIEDAGSRNAFRCFIDQTDADGSNIEDPCFAPPSGGDGSLLCLNSPDARDAVKVVPNARPESHTSAEADPWYVQLDDGTLCGQRGGASDEVNGERLSYACPDGSNLYGEPVRTAAFWTISRQAEGATAFTPARIVRAWV